MNIFDAFLILFVIVPTWLLWLIFDKASAYVGLVAILGSLLYFYT